MRKFKFGVDTFIWSENFSKDDLWIIPKADSLGFRVLDIAVAHPESFPTQEVKGALEKTNLEVVTTTTLGAGTNPISPDPEVRVAAVRSMKTLVDINAELGSHIIGGVNYAGWGYLTGYPRTSDEWNRSVACMRSPMLAHSRKAPCSIPR